MPNKMPASNRHHRRFLRQIFALGCQVSHLSPDAEALVLQTYFDRAKAFASLDLLDLNNIVIVQALLLMTVFLLGTPFPRRCWDSVGVACRLAQGQHDLWDAHHDCSS